MKTGTHTQVPVPMTIGIALVGYQVVEIDDVASGLLYYVAQSFLLAGSIFGLDQYVRFIYRQIQEKKPQRKQKKI